MENVEGYCTQCGKFTDYPMIVDGANYCDDCKEGIDTIKKLREQWVISEDEWLEINENEIDKEMIDEFEKELNFLEKEICNIDGELLEYFKESEYSQDEYEIIQKRMEKIKRILKVD